MEADSGVFASRKSDESLDASTRGIFGKKFYEGKVTVTIQVRRADKEA